MRRTSPLKTPARSLGFTLPEVLAALALIGIVLPAVMKGLSVAMATADDARKKVEAVALAENKLADMTAEAMSGLQAGGTSGDFGADRPAFTWESSSAVVDVDLSQVTVRVSWTSRGALKWVELSSFAYTGGGAMTSGTESGTGTGTQTRGGS